MYEFDLDELYLELEEIEAILGILSSLEENVSIKYVAQVTSEYYDKVVKLKEKIKKYQI